MTITHEEDRIHFFTESTINCSATYLEEKSQFKMFLPMDVLYSPESIDRLYYFLAELREFAVTKQKIVDVKTAAKPDKEKPRPS